MKGRDKLFFTLLSFLLIIVIIVVGIKTRDSDRQLKRWEAEIQARQERGVEDPQLRETVDKLEAALQARILETFSLEEDPLYLIRVITAKKFLGGFTGLGSVSETKMRLSATLVGEGESFALMNFMGRTHMLSVGDKIGRPPSKYRVAAIRNNEIVLKRGNEVLVLPTEKAPDTLAEEERLYGEHGENLPIVEVREVPASN
jgi:Tfp pilus assembly protein PilP